MIVFRYVSGSSPQIEIERGMRHIVYMKTLKAQFGLDGVKLKALDCPSVKRQSWLDKETVVVDTDYARDQNSRKSTAGAASFLGAHFIRTQSNLQSTVSLSSREAEYYGIAEAMAMGCVMRFHSKFRGQHGDLLRLFGCTSFRSTQRTGVTDARPCQMWVQDKVFAEEATVGAVSTVHSVADALTNPVASTTMNRHLEKTSFEFWQTPTKRVL
eukprot:2663148-Amphidinium_carterae.1